jgi:hypothetical protein
MSWNAKYCSYNCVFGFWGQRPLDSDGGIQTARPTNCIPPAPARGENTGSAALEQQGVVFKIRFRFVLW